MTTESEKQSFDFRTIQTFEEACKQCNFYPEKLEAWIDSIPEELSEFKKSIRACIRLMIKYKAVNNGWKAKPSNPSQAKYYPWLSVRPSGSGFSGSDYYFVCALAGTSVGSLLCTFSSEAARHVFDTSQEECKDWYLNLE